MLERCLHTKLLLAQRSIKVNMLPDDQTLDANIIISFPMHFYLSIPMPCDVNIDMKEKRVNHIVMPSFYREIDNLTEPG